MNIGFLRKRKTSKIKRLIIHHSESKNGSVKLFRRIHISDNGWSDIGYHAVIGNGCGMKDGEINPGRDLCYKGAHCKNQNYDSLGVCVVGSFMEKVPSPEQYTALIRLLTEWCFMFNLDPEGKDEKGFIIAAHRDYRPTDCPGDKFYEMLPQIRIDVKRKLKEQLKVPKLSL